MRAEKKLITSEYLVRLNESPYFIVANYQGLSVLQFTELRKRLRAVGSEIHVVKNSIFRKAAEEAGIKEIGDGLTGQVAVATGHKDVAAAAKVLKSFVAEFDKPKVKFGFVGQRRVEKEEIAILADLPPLEVLRGKILGVVNTPATRLVQVIGAPASALARVLKAKAEKSE